MTSYQPEAFWWLIGGLFVVIDIVRAVEERDAFGRFLIWTARKIWRLLIGLALIPVGFLAWHTLAAIPVSIAIILGACIIFCGLRSLPGRARRVMEHSSQLEHERQNYPRLTDV